MQDLQDQLDLQWDYLEARDGRIKQVRQAIIDIFGEMAIEKREKVAQTGLELHEAQKHARLDGQTAQRRDELKRELESVETSAEAKQIKEAQRTLLQVDQQIEELKLKQKATRQQIAELESVLGARKSRVKSQIQALPAINGDMETQVDTLGRQLAAENHELTAIDQGRELWRTVVEYLDELDTKMQGPPIQIESSLEEAVEWLTTKGTFVESQNWGPLVVAIGHELEIVREALQAVKE